MTEILSTPAIPAIVRDILASLGIGTDRFQGGTLVVTSPIDGTPIAAVPETTASDVAAAISRAQAAFLQWRTVPAPRRGELVRRLGEELRVNKAAVGRLVTIEVGKSVSEGLGEVQEMIDICDFAVGLSRQLYGLTIQSERADHRLIAFGGPRPHVASGCLRRHGHGGPALHDAKAPDCA